MTARCPHCNSDALLCDGAQVAERDGHVVQRYGVGTCGDCGTMVRLYPDGRVEATTWQAERAQALQTISKIAAKTPR